MSRIYKVCIVGSDGANEVFAIKPYLESFDSFKEEIFIRLPHLKSQDLKFYYEGKCCSHFGFFLLYEKFRSKRFCVVIIFQCKGNTVVVVVVWCCVLFPPCMSHFALILRGCDEIFAIFFKFT